jgi:polyhydroxybutyrate depolymerase
MAATTPTDGLNSIDVNGVTRGFIFHVPPSYDGKHPFPLVMAFHGKGDMAANLDGYNFLFQMAGGADNVLVYPQALPDPNLQNQPSFERDPADDLLFIDALLASLRGNVCFDTARVFAIGHSLGSTFVQTLACQRGDVIRAIAPQAGDPGMTTGCTGPVAAWVGYGLQDSAGEVAASKARKDFWLSTNHCDPANPVPGDPSPPCVQYTCTAGYPVEWCEDPAGTHKWSPWMTQSIFDFFGAFAP